MKHSPYRATVVMGISLFTMSCSKDGLDTARDGGPGGTIGETSGTIGGTSGTSAGTGGTSAGTSSTIGGTSGAVAGAGGTLTSTSGAGGNRGSGGETGATGGATVTPDAAPPGCVWGEHTYAIGEKFSADCNTCICAAYGSVCTERACILDASPDRTSGPDLGSPCTLSANLTFGRDGGNALYGDSNRLTASTFTITRNYSLRMGRDGAASATCSPPLPACGAADVVSVATINTDLADADVQWLWNLRDPVLLFGTDPRPVDGTVYSIALDDGHKVLVGGQCASPSMSSCRYIPAGLLRLTQDLQKLAATMLADPACKGL